MCCQATGETRLGGGGHHLADPGQCNNFSRARTRCSFPDGLCRPATRRRFSLDGDGSSPIRTSHPSGSRRWGCSRGGGARPLVAQPQKIVGTLPRSKWSAEPGERLGALAPHKVRPAVATPAPCSQIAGPSRGAVQPLAGSMAEASRSRVIAPWRLGGMRRWPIRSGGCWPTPFRGSPAHPLNPVQAKARVTSKSVPSRRM